MNVFLESLTSEFDKSMNTIDSFYQIAQSQYLLEKSNAETLYLSESVDECQMEYLYEEAEKSFKEKVSKTIETIKTALKNFCDKISEKLKGSTTGLSECETKAKHNPFMKKGEVKIEDTREEIKLCDKFSDKVKNLAIKFKSGVAKEEDVEELKNEYKNERKKIAVAVATTVTVPIAISLWKKYTEKPASNMNQLTDDNVVWECDYVELAKLKSEISRDKATAIYKMTESAKNAVTSFAKSISNKQDEKNVEESTEDEVMIDTVNTGFNELLTNLLESVMGSDEESTVFTEEAKFSLFPKFKKLSNQYPELNNAENLIKKINNELEAGGEEPTPTRCKNIQKVLLEILTFIESLSSLVMLPFCIFIAPIFSYLLQRLVTWETANYKFAITESQLETMIAKVKKLANAEKSPKTKKKYEEMLAELEKALDDVRSFSKKETEKATKESTEDIDAFSEIMEMSVEDKLSFVNMYLRESETEFAMETCNQVNQLIHERKMEVVTDIIEDVVEDHLTESFEAFEIY